MADRRTYGVEVILGSDISKHPFCPHGPTLLFERFSKDKDNGRMFYACSASRDRKECGFFRYFDDKKASTTTSSGQTSKSIKLDYSRSEYMKRLKTFTNLPENNRKFCQKCSKLVLPDEFKAHTSHGFLETIPNHKLTKPSSLLRPKETNKTNAQYFFTDKTVNFIIETLKRFMIQRVICIGAPTIHDSICNQKCGIQSLLLDIDSRFAQFYDEQHYLQYNLFNHHFFDVNSREIFTNFISSPEKTAIILDPPFGGLIDVISHTLKQLKTLRKMNLSELSVLWFFPYFNEDRIIKNLPELKMMDYKVDYENHASFNSNKGRKQGSPVRIFTNLEAEKFELPLEEGCRFCDKCRRYVAKENKHCDKCDACTSKDGRPYKHCSLCKICVKSTKSHCKSCNHCVLPNHVCGEVKANSSCHRCGQEGHKRTDCPMKDNVNTSKRKRRK